MATTSEATARSQPVAPARVVDRDAGVQRCQRQFTRRRIGTEDAEIGDDDLRPATAQTQPLSSAWPVAEAERGHEIDALDERPRGLAQQHEHLTTRRGDLRGAAGAGEANFRARVVADDGGVDVGEAVDLRTSEEADVDATRLQPVVEHLGHTDNAVSGVRQLAVADRQWQRHRLRAERARLVDEHEVRGVGVPSEVGGRARQADADEAHVPVAQATGRGHDHRVIARAHDVRTRITCSSSHSMKRSRWAEMASHSR